MREVRENRRVAMTKRLLKEALIDTMEQKPIRQITVKEICEKADVNRSTFYLHYNDQLALLEEMQNEVFEKLPRIEAADAQELLYKLQLFFVYLELNRHSIAVILKSQIGGAFRARIIDSLFEQHATMTADKADWYHNTDVNNHEQLLFLIYVSGCFSVIEKWVNGEIRGTSMELARAMSQLILSHD